mmetsp:Transcript_35354/g.63043  ORF Transcript_35354/g.63043 Transcript_35354/m.63043 type:complete len:268 (+) Transcript_35354:153-956(+)
MGGRQSKHEGPGVRCVEEQPVHRHGEEAGQRGEGVARAKDEPRVARRDVQVRHANATERESAEAQPNGDDERTSLRIPGSQRRRGYHQTCSRSQHPQHLQRNSDSAHPYASRDQSVCYNPAHGPHATLNYIREHCESAQLPYLNVVVLAKESRKPVDEAVQTPRLSVLSNADGEHLPLSQQLQKLGRIYSNACGCHGCGQELLLLLYPICLLLRRQVFISVWNGGTGDGQALPGWLKREPCWQPQDCQPPKEVEAPLPPGVLNNDWG